MMVNSKIILNMVKVDTNFMKTNTMKDNFLKNKITGKGKYVLQNGIIYEGVFKEGRLNGLGDLTTQKGRYEDQFVDGKRQG